MDGIVQCLPAHALFLCFHVSAIGFICGFGLTMLTTTIDPSLSDIGLNVKSFLAPNSDSRGKWNAPFHCGTNLTAVHLIMSFGQPNNNLFVEFCHLSLNKMLFEAHVIFHGNNPKYRIVSNKRSAV